MKRNSSVSYTISIFQEGKLLKWCGRLRISIDMYSYVRRHTSVDVIKYGSEWYDATINVCSLDDIFHGRSGSDCTGEYETSST